MRRFIFKALLVVLLSGILYIAACLPIVTAEPLPTPSLVLLGAGARCAAGNGSSVLFINWKDNWIAHYLTDGATWGPWPSESKMDDYRFSISCALEHFGFEIEFAGDMPESLEDYDLVVISAYWAIEPQHEPLVRDYIFNGGNVVLLAGVPSLFVVYSKDWWTWPVGGDLSAIEDWFGASGYGNTAGSAFVMVDNPFGTEFRVGDAVAENVGPSAAAVTQVNPEAEIIAKWEYGYTFAFTHEYGQGRVYYQAWFEAFAFRCDINGDSIVDMRDLGIVARAFGSTEGSELWNANADINGDKKIDMRDLGIVARNFGISW